MDTLRATIEALAPDLTETRHHLHRHPELSGNEAQTAAFVADRLRALGLEVQIGVGGHGVVATLEGKGAGRTLALRADMDALPILEANQVDYCSRNPGVMHACGHDGHTTTLLGTATVLTALRETFAGRVQFLFQPAEETVGGARQMCDQGVMEGVDAAVALHGWPGIDVGKIGVRVGAMMASADMFDIVIEGRGAHAAYPHQAIDPIMVGAQLVTALQSIASRETDPNDPVVVSVTRFEAGTAYNVIPSTARLAGTVRTLSRRTRELMPERLRRLAEAVCAAHRASCQVTFTDGTPPVENDAEIISLIEDVCARAFGQEAVVQIPYSSMGAEDFAFYLDHAPGAMFRLGLGDVSPIHTPTFNFDDRALPVGVELFCRIALTYLMR